MLEKMSVVWFSPGSNGAPFRISVETKDESKESLGATVETSLKLCNVLRPLSFKAVVIQY